MIYSETSKNYGSWQMGALLLYLRSPKGEGGILFYLCPSVRPSKKFFCRIFLINCCWEKSDIWSQASYRYTILWVAFLDPLDSHFLFADLVGFYTHWTYMHIFHRIFLSNYWWQKSDIWSQASYRYAISWEAFFDPSDSYFLFAEERGYHKWALAHSSSCLDLFRLILKLMIANRVIGNIWGSIYSFHHVSLS